jgi:diguanylate cyclase (GGDEF)-like protein/PAS domain S-box-containing protein
MVQRTLDVLLVEDDADDKFLTVEALRDVEGTRYEVTWVTSVDAAVDEIRSGNYDVALLDYRLGAQTGLDILKAIDTGEIHTPCILLTGQRDRDTDLAAMEAGAADYLVKGEITPVELERTIRYAIERADGFRSLRESELRFRAVVEAATDAILLTDDNGRLLTWNRAALELFGLDDRTASEQTLGGLMADRDVHPKELHDLPTNTDLHGHRIDGSTFPAALSLASYEGARGRLWSAIVRDVTTQRSLEGRLLHQAFHDPLTTLANRALFSNRVDHAIIRLRRRPGALGVLFLDLDDFKRINDSFGHAIGDTVLVSVAERLVGCVRSNDTVARFGGDEFAVLVEDTDDPRISFVVADRIMRAMGPSFSIGDREIDLSCSIGIAVATSDDVTGSELLRDADLAMYSAKNKGKNCVELFEDRMHAVIMDRVTVEAELRQAVERGEIIAYYQPILDLATGHVKGFEALARWNHPQRGVLSPAVFIDIAESNGLIVPIGRSILEQAVHQTRDWQDRYPSAGRLTVSVNLSVRQIEEPMIVQTVADALYSSQLAPDCLILEITESLVVKRGGTSGERLAKIAELGVGLAVDDFGTGYSSLAYLQDLPLTILKVDRSFVDRIDDARGSALVEAIVAMSKSLGLSTIAEGIETAGQLRALTDFGCVYGQGFLFAKPLSVNDVEILLGGDSVFAKRRVATSA